MSKDNSALKTNCELSRELTLFQITMMGMGMMIGAGVFLGMGISIGTAGPGGAILTFSLNGFLAILTAMSFAELSSAIPRAGGAYNFARIGFGRSASFMAGWMEWFASSVAGSMYALTFAIYVVRFIDTLGIAEPVYAALGIDSQSFSPVLEKLIAGFTALIFIYINYRGSSETGKIGAIITMGQTAFVLAIGITGIVVVIKDPQRLENFSPFVPLGWSQILITMGFTYVAFEGYEVIAQAGDEAIEPKKNLPKAMLYSVLIVTVIYVLVAFATVVSVKVGSEGVDKPVWEWIGQYKAKGFGEAVARLLPLGNFILTLAVIFSSTSALNATIYSGTRASYALGRDGMLPPFWAKIHPKKRTPYGALTATGIMILVVALFLPTEDVASSASIMFLFLFFMVNVCVIKIRLSMADELQYGYMLPFFPLPPILAIIAQAVLAVWLVHMSWLAWVFAPLWIIAGVMIYNIYSKSHTIAAEHEVVVLDEEVSHKSKGYSVMVALANPANAVELVKSTYRICDAKDANIELIHMVPVPGGVPLYDADDYKEYMIAGREGLKEAMLYLSLHFPINLTIRYCRNVARGIVGAIKEKKTDMLVLGWHGSASSIFNIGSTIDPLIEQSPCDVVVLKDCGRNKKFHNILVPIAGGPNSALALEIALIMTENSESTVTVMTIDRGGKQRFDIEQFADKQASMLGVDRKRLITKTVKSKSTVIGILRASKSCDLIVLGTTNKPVWRQFASRSIPEKVACRSKKPTIMVKSGQGVHSWLRKWI